METTGSETADKLAENIYNIQNEEVEEENEEDLEVDGGDDIDAPSVNFQMSVTSAVNEQEAAEPTDQTPMISAAPNGKLTYNIGGMEVVEVVSSVFV